MTTSTPPPPSSSQWHSVTPSTRPLTLTIIELTPLALTLSLTLATTTPHARGSSSNSSTHHAHPSTPTQHHASHPSTGKHRKKARHRRDSDEELAHLEHDDFGEHHLSLVPGSWPTTMASTNFKDLLSHGVVVSVNGQPWSRIVAHVSDPDDEEEEGIEGDNTDDQWEDEWDHAGEDTSSVIEDVSGVVTRRRPRRSAATLNSNLSERMIKSRRRKPDKDRAVVVVYGLSPGREYEIDLKVVGAVDGDGVSNTIIVPSSPATLHPHSRSRANSLRSRSRPRSRSNSLNATSPLSQDTTSNPQITPPSTPIPTSVLNPVDTQAAQLRHLIAAAHVEKEHLLSQMKEARRASQRAEAAIKLEIETMKRASEKAGAMDLRAKQKALALGEQVKQGWAGVESAEGEMMAVESGLSTLEARLESYKTEVEGVRMEWRVVKEKEDDIRERDKKARSEEDRKLAEVIAKVDKLKARRDKKSSDTSDLERRLEELEKEREQAESRNQNTQPRLSAHPSLNNLNQYASGPGFRPRGNYHPRYPSGGSNRPPPLPSPTHSQTFYPNATTSPAFRPLKPPATTTSPSNSTRPPPTVGVNVAAAPFHPSYTVYDTTLMPPQLQHRIYLPNIRPRPAPNFHPPPSVVAEQQQAAAQIQAQTSSPPTLSPPAFPPLPSQLASSSNNPGSTSPGGSTSKPSAPSLASIVTRAVLAPGSGALASQGITGTNSQRDINTRPSPPPGRSNPYSGLAPNSGNQFNHSAYSPSSQTSVNHSPNPNNPSSSPVPPQSTHQRVTFVASPQSSGEFPHLSPNGPWGSGSGGSGMNQSARDMMRTRTPPVGWMNGGGGSGSGSGSGSNSAGRESPAGGIGV